MRFFEFSNPETAYAFADGVEWVNDGDVEVKGVFCVPGSGNRRVLDQKYFVQVEDDGMDFAKHDRQPARWNQRFPVTKP